ncbi:hypothetical protein BDV27DRAFT_152990 [Aspergillus caelatus]|uniref:Uncharacterized protein n=1 Tax=Aspergillus caelatus TaxID=61420 RepID=A0A5N7AKD0_9EURO|nr:uncharacterized protein BDV27DRAFT_152990 [Aspergillus caelatus]KAE8369498.1 hypothetical protein BDV27DRAFT_152990 [Aspergillus caelatus]
MDESIAIDLLDKCLFQRSLLQDRENAISLVDNLTFLPLVIVQAAAYINENDIDLNDYITLLKEQEPEVVELLGENFEDDADGNVQHPVATIWLISFHQIQ